MYLRPRQTAASPPVRRVTSTNGWNTGKEPGKGPHNNEPLWSTWILVCRLAGDCYWPLTCK